MKETAVEWMFEQFFKVKWGSMQGNMPTIFEQAKEMEKEQMLNFYMWMRINERAEEYFHYTDEDMFAEYLKQAK